MCIRDRNWNIPFDIQNTAWFKQPALPGRTGRFAVRVTPDIPQSVGRQYIPECNARPIKRIQSQIGILGLPFLTHAGSGPIRAIGAAGITPQVPQIIGWSGADPSLVESQARLTVRG